MIYESPSLIVACVIFIVAIGVVLYSDHKQREAEEAEYQERLREAARR